MDEASPPDLRLRLRAAREFAGHESAKALADAVKEPGLGKSKLYAFEQGKDTPTRSQLYAIASACGLPAAWFDPKVDLAEVIRTGLAREGLRPDQIESGWSAIATARQAAQRRRKGRGEEPASSGAEDGP